MRASISKLRVALVLSLALASCAAPPPPARAPRAPAPPPAARPQVEPFGDLRVLAEVFQTVKTQYVTPIDEGTLTASCNSGIWEYAAKLSPPLDLSDVRPLESAQPGEQIGAVLGEAKRRRPEIDRRAMVDACLAMMVGNLDKQSSYLDAEKFRDLQASSSPQVGGIGVELKVEKGFPIVVSVIEGTPAARSDLAPGDAIVKIDGVSTEGLSLEETVRRMRGKPQSSLMLTLRRAGAPEPIQRTFKREVIRVRTVRQATTPEGYAHIRLTMFSENTLDGFASALKSAYGDGAKPVPGIILDLRNNPGGLLNTAVGVAAVFLPQDALVTELKGRIDDFNKRLVASPVDYLRGQRMDPLKSIPEAMKKAPLVVIVNRQTASGAELVAAALQDHRRARLIGERTFGLGTIQSIIPMDSSTAIKLTMAKFYRPNGQTTDGHPIAPDVLLSQAEAALPTDASADQALTRARALLGSK